VSTALPPVAEPPAHLGDLLPPAEPSPAAPPVPAHRSAAAAPRKTGPIATSSASGRAAGPRVGGETAGFWIRLAAYLIDMVIVGLVVTAIIVPTAMLGGALGERSAILAVLVILLGSILATVVALGYQIWFWASRGATPGKQVLKLEVVRQDGVAQLGYAKAAIRALGYILSSFLGIGFLMIAFTDGRLGLHDMMAGTRVVRKG
jgi:uncharacterized RDD family membrane protein YckC